MVDYVFKPYDPAFPQIFKTEKGRLKQFLSGDYVIEHFGSTAVMNLGGKGIIDIYLIVPEEKLQDVFQEVIAAGYEARPNSGTETRFIYIRVDESQQRYHLHITTKEEGDYTNALRFRDYLRNHQEEANRYAESKKQAAEEIKKLPQGQRKEAYMRIKEKIILDVLRKASL
jgi:GrpB-like predicted nucleotidyltransferase (UPF0157 family)